MNPEMGVDNRPQPCTTQGTSFDFIFGLLASGSGLIKIMVGPLVESWNLNSSTIACASLSLAYMRHKGSVGVLRLVDLNKRRNLAVTF